MIPIGHPFVTRPYTCPMTRESESQGSNEGATTPTFRVALAQVNPTVGDIKGNTRLITDHIQRAREAQADLVAFPELCVTGYPPEDLLYKDSFLDAADDALKQIVEASEGITVVVGIPERAQIPSSLVGEGEGGGMPPTGRPQEPTPANLYNAAAVIHDGKLIDIYRKIFLPNYSVFDEERYFTAGNLSPVYEIGGARIGVNVCEDIWFERGPTNVQKAAGAQVIININGSPYYRGKRAVREVMLSQRAADNGIFLCYVNMIGGQDELVFDGASMIFDPRGKTITTGRQFDDDFVLADLPLHEADTVSQTAVLDPDDPQNTHFADYTVIPVTKQEEQGATRKPLSETQHANPMTTPMGPVEEVYNALVKGTQDYVRKSGFSQVVIGLSGGIDSALTAAVAADALGPENVLCLSMPSRYTADQSITDARALCEKFGISFEIIAIEDMTNAYRDGLANLFAGTQEGVAEENLQARARGNILMAISNKFGRIVLATGNKSEYATGYATLYGDMAGGFAVIKDVPKTLVYELANWRNEQAGHDIIPQAIIDRPPTAELRENQLDEDSLPPYDVLDPVLEAYVERDVSPKDMIEKLGFDRDVVARVTTLVDISEYKRRQAAPGVKITERAFGKDRRLPIVNRYRPG